MFHRIWQETNNPVFKIWSPTSDIASIISRESNRHACRHAADIRIHPTSFHSKLWRGCPSLPSPLCASCRSSHWDFLLWTPLLISMWHVSLLFLQGHRFLNLQIKSHHSSSEHAPNELGPQFWRAPWKGGPHSLLSWLLPSVTMWTRL